MRPLPNLSSKIPDISSNFSFYLLLGFLFLTSFTIAGCYVILTLLVIQLAVFLVREKTLPRLPGFYKYFILFIVFTLVSTLFSIDKTNSLLDNKEIFIFLLFPILFLTIDSRRRLNYSLFAVLLSAVISSLVGIVTSIMRGISLDDRLKGFTSHWMTYAGLLMLVFIFFFVYLFFEKRKKLKIFFILSLAVIFTAVIFSLTRSAWLGITVSLGIFIILYKPKFLIPVIPAAVVLLLLLPDSIKSRVSSIVDPQNETNRDRIFMVYTGFQVFKHYPLTGVGPDNIEKVYKKYKHPDTQKINMHLHNNFLQVLAERGILALIALVLAFISIFIGLIHKIKNSIGAEKTVAVGVLFTFIGFLVTGMFEYNFGDSEIKFLLFYFLSIPFLHFKEAEGAAADP